jgi:hypothetical protein
MRKCTKKCRQESEQGEQQRNSRGLASLEKEERFLKLVFKEFGFEYKGKNIGIEKNVVSMEESIRTMAATMENQNAIIERMQQRQDMAAQRQDMAAQRQEETLQRLQNEIASLKQA